METKLLVSSTRPLCCSSSSLPFFLSYKTPKPSVKPHFSKSQFLGKSLRFEEKRFSRNPEKSNAPFGPIRAVVKRRKEVPFDNVIQRDKKLKLVLKIRRILVEQPNRVMSLKQLGRFRRDLGLDKKRRFISLLRKFPAVFEIVEEGAFSLKFKMTPEAESLYFEETKLKNGMEDLLVVKLRKLLMMSMDKRILLEKIAHLKNDLGLPLEFKDTICHRYPQYFRVVATARGPALELTHWDPELAISAAEMSEEDNRAREIEERDLIIDRPLKFKRVTLPKGLILSKGEMRRLGLFRDIPFISPYSDFSELRSGTIEKEKHACAVVHEILSLTTEKKLLVDHFTHFREEFRFSQQLRGMLIRHPDMFYVSLKGDRDSCFLREAYRDSQLIDKDRLTIIKEKFRSLVTVPRFPKRGGRRLESDEEAGSGEREAEDGDEDEGDESGEEWSVDDFVNEDGFDDDEDDDEDEDGDWSDDEDDTPPQFDDEVGDSVASNGAMNLDKVRGDSSVKDEIKLLEPVLPDGRPRERW